MLCYRADMINGAIVCFRYCFDLAASRGSESTDGTQKRKSHVVYVDLMAGANRPIHTTNRV